MPPAHGFAGRITEDADDLVFDRADDEAAVLLLPIHVVEVVNNNEDEVQGQLPSSRAIGHHQMAVDLEIRIQDLGPVA